MLLGRLSEFVGSYLASRVAKNVAVIPWPDKSNCQSLEGTGWSLNLNIVLSSLYYTCNQSRKKSVPKDFWFHSILPLQFPINGNLLFPFPSQFPASHSQEIKMVEMCVCVCVCVLGGILELFPSKYVWVQHLATQLRCQYYPCPHPLPYASLGLLQPLRCGSFYPVFFLPKFYQL